MISKESVKNWLHIRNGESLLGLFWIYRWTLGLHCALYGTVTLGTCNKVLLKEMCMTNSICNWVVGLGKTERRWSLGDSTPAVSCAPCHGWVAIPKPNDVNLREPKVPKDQKWPMRQTCHWNKQILMGRVNTAEHPGSKEDVFVLFGSRDTHEIMVKTTVTNSGCPI